MGVFKQAPLLELGVKVLEHLAVIGLGRRNLGSR
jgi:hypothetical protein